MNTFVAEPVRLYALPNGLAGTDATLRLMKQEIIEGSRNPYVRQFTAGLIAGIRPQKNALACIARIFDYVRDEIAYIPDIMDVETLHGAEFILKHKYGDCDDKVIVLCACLRSVGFQTEIHAVIHGNNGHVIAAVPMNGKNFYLDPTERVPAGWFPLGVFQVHKSLRIEQ